MRRFLDRLDTGLTRSLELFIVVAMTLLVLDVVWGVFTRYALGEQAKWTEELARFLLVWVAMLGAAVAFGRKAHLGVDLFVESLHPDARRPMTVIAHLVVLLFAAMVFLVGGWRVVSSTLALGQATPALGWKMGFVYLVLPISGLCMTVYSVRRLVESLALPPSLEAPSDPRETGAWPR